MWSWFSGGKRATKVQERSPSHLEYNKNGATRADSTQPSNYAYQEVIQSRDAGSRGQQNYLFRSQQPDFGHTPKLRVDVPADLVYHQNHSYQKSLRTEQSTPRTGPLSHKIYTDETTTVLRQNDLSSPNLRDGFNPSNHDIKQYAHPVYNNREYYSKLPSRYQDGLPYLQSNHGNSWRHEDSEIQHPPSPYNHQRHPVVLSKQVKHDGSHVVGQRRDIPHYHPSENHITHPVKWNSGNFVGNLATSNSSYSVESPPLRQTARGIYAMPKIRSIDRPENRGNRVMTRYVPRTIGDTDVSAILFGATEREVRHNLLSDNTPENFNRSPRYPDGRLEIRQVASSLLYNNPKEKHHRYIDPYREEHIRQSPKNVSNFRGMPSPGFINLSKDASSRYPEALKSSQESYLPEFEADRKNHLSAFEAVHDRMYLTDGQADQTTQEFPRILRNTREESPLNLRENLNISPSGIKFMQSVSNSGVPQLNALNTQHTYQGRTTGIVYSSSPSEVWPNDSKLNSRYRIAAAATAAANFYDIRPNNTDNSSRISNTDKSNRSSNSHNHRKISFSDNSSISSNTGNIGRMKRIDKNKKSSNNDNIKSNRITDNSVPHHISHDGVTDEEVTYALSKFDNITDQDSETDIAIELEDIFNCEGEVLY